MKHIPNILSFFRIVLIPFFVWQMLKDNTWNAAVILGISGLTDLLDGFLARRYNWISQLGKVLDPVADKLTQVTVCVVLAYKLARFWPFFAVLLFKDLIMLILGGYLVKKGVRLDGARWFGKVVTVLFYVSMVAIVFIPDMPGWLITTLLSVTTGCAIIAALLYIPEFIKYRNKAKAGKT